MPTAQMQVVEGQTTVSSAPFSINLGFVPTSFHFWNQSKFASGTTNQIVEGEWNQNLPDGYLYAYNTDGSDAITPELMATGGIYPWNGALGPELGPVQAGTTITKTTGSFAIASHGLVVGDVFVVLNPAVMKQLGGNFFQVATVSDANNVIITNPGFMNTANFSNETSFNIRKLKIPVQFVPKVSVIVNISQANPMVVTTSVAHGLVAGQKVKVRVPDNFGMVEANGLSGVITAVTATTFTIGSIDSSAFTAFAWPASASPFESNFAQVVPFGSGPFGSPDKVDLLDDKVLNQAFQGVLVGVGDGTLIMPVATDVIQWRAIRADSNS